MYEGVWKITHRHEFSAEPFLSQAKGPVSGLFYAMLPDLYGQDRLEPLKKTKDGKVEVVHCAWLTDRWEGIRNEFLAFYATPGNDEKQQAAQKRLEHDSEELLNKFKKDLEEGYLVDNYKDMQAYFGSLKRFEDDPERHQDAPFQKQRRWERMMKLRGEAGAWIKELDGRETAFKDGLYGLLNDDQKARGPLPTTWNPFEWSRMQQINFAVTFGLTAIGVCLLLGLCTRLAALGGAAFMCFVVLTQPAWPTIFPHDLPVVGHALLINKDFIEMLALLTIATTVVGRWGGLDYFVHHLIVDPILSKTIRKTTEPK